MTPEQFARPRNFDANLVVVGAGAAGLVSAYVAATARARVVLIEEGRMGGDCLHTGCVPSKTLIRSARIATYLRRAGDFGLHAGDVTVDFARVMERVRRVIAEIGPHDSAERYTRLGVECVTGHARLRSPWEVEVGGRVICSRAIVIATGGRPAVPPVPGLAELDYLTSDTVWELDELPHRLLVLGGGPVGCELAQAFRRLGSEVMVVEILPRLLVREDPDISETLEARLVSEGIRVLTGWQPRSFSGHGAGGSLELARDQQISHLDFDRVLVATGRRAHTSGLGLEKLGIAVNPNGTLVVNDYLQTAYPNIYACGDVAGPYQLTHAAAHQGWHCATNALFGTFRKSRVNYAALPWTVFTDPEIGRVGLNENDARAAGIPCEVTRYEFTDLDRAIIEGEAQGFIKVLTAPGSDRVLGATIVGPQAGELIAEFVLAMRHRLGLRKILNTIHAYPTLAEANRFVAGGWQRAHLSPRLLALAARYHRWRRG